MGLPAVDSRILYGPKRAGYPLFFKPAIPIFHQSHFTDSDNPDYRLHDLQSHKKESNRRFCPALVPGNLRNLDTAGYHIQPDYLCILFSVNDARNLHRYRDCNIRLAKLFKETAGRTEPVNDRYLIVLRRNRLLPVRASGGFYSL